MQVSAMRLGVDFEITLDGYVIPDAIAAQADSDDRGNWGWVETPRGVRYGRVEFRSLHQ